LAFGEPNILTGGRQLRVGVLAKGPFDEGGMGFTDGVVGTGRRDPPTVDNDKDAKRERLWQRVPGRRKFAAR